MFSQCFCTFFLHRVDIKCKQIPNFGANNSYCLLDESQTGNNQAYAKNTEKKYSHDDLCMKMSAEPKIPCEFCDGLIPESEFILHSVCFLILLIIIFTEF